MLQNGKKMLLLCGYKSIYGGNFVPSLMALEEKLNTYGISCIYAFPKEARSRQWIAFLKTEGKNIVFFDINLSYKDFVLKLAKIVDDNQINYIHSHFTPILKMELFAKLHKEIKVFYHIHSDFSAGKKDIKQKLKTKLVYKLFSGNVVFFSVSKAFVEFNPKKIFYVPNGLAKNRIACNHVGRKQVRDEYKVTDDEVLCEIFGWTPVVKGVDIAVNAIQELNVQNNIKVKLAIVCGREMTVERMKKWISQNTNCSGEEDYLIYWEPKEDVFSYHEAADILISSSRSEGFSYSILEMLSLGKTCVVSDIPGVAWAKKYETTISFLTESVSGCVDALCKAIDNNCRQNAEVADSVQKDFAIDAWIESIIDKMNQTT